MRNCISIFIFTIFSVADCEPRCRLVLTGLTTNTCLHLPAEEGRLHSPVRQTRAGQDREELSSTTADQTSGFSHSPTELQELENINSVSNTFTIYINKQYTLLPSTATQSTQYVRCCFTLSDFKMKRFHRNMSKKWSRLGVYSLGRIS